MVTCCGRYSYLHSVSYLTLTAGDKGIKCLSTSPRRCRKGTVRGATACHDGDLVSVACHIVPLAAQPPAMYAGKGPGATRRWVSWSAGTEWLPTAARALPRPVSCRPGNLSLAGSCRDAWRAAAGSLRCSCWASQQDPLAGVLYLEWPSRQAPLAGDLSP